MNLSWIIIQKIFTMFLLTLAGFICTKAGIIDTNTGKKLSALSLKLITPMLIFSSYHMEYDARIVKNLGISFLLVFLAYAIQIPLAFLLARKSKNGGNRHNLERLCLIFTNCGFFGIPLINGLYGEEGVVYLTAFFTVFNILIWILGVPLLTGKSSQKDTLKNIISPATVASLLGLITLLLRIRLPAIIIEPIEMIGSSIAMTKWSTGLQNPRLYYITACKNLIIPAVAVCIYALLPLEPMLIMIPIFAIACPVAAACPMFSVMYDQDTDYASQLFAVTTLLSIVTIPLIYLLASSLGV